MEFLIDDVLDKIVELMVKIKIANEKIAERKRRKKIKKYLLELCRLNALEKIKVEDLVHLQKSDEINKKKWRWFVDYDDEYLF